MRGGNFSYRVSQIYQHYLKNDEKLNKKDKQVFSTKSKEQNQNRKRTEVIPHMKGLPPPQYLVRNRMAV